MELVGQGTAGIWKNMKLYFMHWSSYTFLLSLHERQRGSASQLPVSCQPFNPQLNISTTTGANQWLDNILHRRWSGKIDIRGFSVNCLLRFNLMCLIITIILDIFVDVYVIRVIDRTY